MLYWVKLAASILHNYDVSAMINQIHYVCKNVKDITINPIVTITVLLALSTLLFHGSPVNLAN